MRVRWTKGARAQLLEIFKFVARQRPVTASRLVTRLRKSAAALGDQPLSGRVVPEFADPTIRERLAGRYRIIYAVKSDSVFILSIYDGKRLLPDSPDKL